MDNNPDTNLTELQPWDWLIQINQKLTFLQLKVINHKEISEDDNELLKVLYRIYWCGEYQLYSPQVAGIAETSVQTGLFADRTAEVEPEIIGGKVIDVLAMNQKD